MHEDVAREHDENVERVRFLSPEFSTSPIAPKQSGARTLVSSQKRSTSALSAYATHLVLFISPMLSWRLPASTSYLTPSTRIVFSRRSAPSQSSRVPGLKESVSVGVALGSDTLMKHDTSEAFEPGTWQTDEYALPERVGTLDTRCCATGITSRAVI